MAPANHHSMLAAWAFMLSTAVGFGLPSETVRAESSRYEITPVPEWVRALPGDTHTSTLDADAANGAATLLVDRQIRIQDGWSEYDRYVTRVVNPAGIDDASQITINFDPELDHLRIHAVTLRRGARTIDELTQGRIELLQRESHLEQATLDGSLTFHLVMSDVRVGDVIDCRYTVEHHNPAWDDRFFGRVLVRWDEPVRRSRLLVLAPEHAPLYFRAGAAGAPVKRQEGRWQLLEWNWSRLAGVAAEPGAPSWYEQYPAIQFSQFTDWSQVASAELPLFTVRRAQGPELASVVERLRSGSTTNAERALTALHFVQEEVRYTGLELGTHAYRPTLPDEVLRRRYGDCKDKTLLAVTLLRALDIDAEPALVSSRWMRHLSERLPSPSDFDHAIVRVRLGSQTYWLDPTLTAQGGRLDTLAQADFGEALVIAPGINAPEPIPSVAPRQPLVSASATFDLRAGLDRDAVLNVTTVYRGSAAENLRRRLRRTSPAQLGAAFLNYYRARFADIGSAGTPQFQDDLVANEITVDESYRLARPFEASRLGEGRLALSGDLVSGYLTAPARTVRTTPLAVQDHADIAERITVRLPRPLPLDRSGVTIETHAFRYESRIEHAGNDLTIDYRYRSLDDAIPTSELDGFLDKLAQARANAEMTLTDRNSQPRLTLGSAVDPVR